MLSLLSDESKVTQFAQQLIAMAEYYNFDGWLVNIENPIHVSWYTSFWFVPYIYCTCICSL